MTHISTRVSDNQPYSASRSSRQNSRLGMSWALSVFLPATPECKYTVMTNPINHLGDIDEALDLVHEAASRYLASLPDRPVRPPPAELIAPTLGGTLPEDGDGTL